MRIVFLSSSYPIFKKGHFQNPCPVHVTAKKLIERGHSIHVITPHIEGGLKEETKDGVFIHRFGKNMHLDFRKIGILNSIHYLASFLLKTLEVVKKHDIQIIHSFWAIPAGIVGLIASRISGKPYIVELMGSDVFLGLKNFLTKSFVKIAINKADYVMADGKSLIDFATTHGCTILNYFVHSYEANLPEVSENQVKRFKKKFKIKEGEQVLLNSRIKDKLYGIEETIDALKLIALKYPKIKLLLLGTIGKEYKEFLSKKIQELGIEEKTVFTGFLDDEEYACALKTADIYLSPSFSDSTSVALLKAMRIGLPVIVSNIGDNPYWVKNEVNGVVVEKIAGKEIAEAIEKLLNAKNLDELKKKNIERIAKECDLAEIIQKQEEIYSKLI